jgi:hypothetical protein
MKLIHIRICLVALCLIALTNVALGQEESGGRGGAVPAVIGGRINTSFLSTIPPDGLESGGYRIHQSMELGYRVSEITGSNAMYETLVDQHGGPRMLEQSLSMQSIEHQGVLFDNFFIHSFGWGGDAENGLRLRVDKNHWFDLRGNFRRDQNRFDYNLLANPLNPPTSAPTIAVGFSPHSFATTRRMTDVDLTILPESVVSFRMGYSHNNMAGNSFSSVHEGTDALLYQPWNTTLDSYRLGADLRLIPHTVISYDQLLDYYRGDNYWTLAPFASASISGTGVELGLPIDSVGKVPCAPGAGNTSLIDVNGNLTNPACSAYFSYNRTDRIRTSIPTERISLHGSYFDRLDIAAGYAYSSAEMDAPLDEFFNGLMTRTRTRQFTVTGPARARRISNVGELATTLRLNRHLRVTDSFRFWAFRTPQSIDLTETDWKIPGAGACTAPACTLTVPLAATAQSVTTTSGFSTFNQNWKRNETDLIWDASKRFGGRIGFRYGTRLLNHVIDFLTADADVIEVHEYTPVLGFWVKPRPNLRFNFDAERTSNDETLVRIGTRKEDRYRFQANYSPKPWVLVGGSANLWEGKNGAALTDYRGHNRNFGVTTTILPKGRYGFDFAYNYNDYQQNARICFNDADASLSVVTGAGNCNAGAYQDAANPLLTEGIYSSTSHYGMGLLTFKPAARLTSQAGYSITSVGGLTPQFNKLQPFGTLRYNFHQPLANLTMDLGHNLEAKAGWNYHQYGEGSFVGPTDPRYFHANNAIFGLRWAF